MRPSLHALFLLIALTWPFGQAQAVIPSIMVNWDLLAGKPSGEFQLFVPGSFAYRYSHSAKMTLASRVNQSAGSYDMHRVNDNLKLHYLLWVTDQKLDIVENQLSHSASYLGLGYNQQSTLLETTSITASGGSLVYTQSTRPTKVIHGALAIGFFGGDEHFIGDARMEILVNQLEEPGLGVRKKKTRLIFGFGYIF